jgi:Mechanosensitive ion channel, conserved TM helix
MLDQVNTILKEATARASTSIAEFLPRLLALAVILILAALIAWIARAMIRRSLQRIHFDRRVEQWGLAGLAEWSPANSPSLLMAAITFWFIVLIGLLIGLSALDANLTSTFVYRLLNYLPHVFAAVLILVVGLIFARFVARGVLISAVNLQIQWARLLSLGVKWLVMVLAGAMALEHLGIGGQIVQLAFGILFGGIVLALALAVGLGSKDIVSRSLERQAGRNVEQEQAANRFHHL